MTSIAVAEVVVLLGAPGSGKSTVGRVLVERWGSRQAFIADKKDLLPLLHEEILEWIVADSPRQ